jgi:hypothetical protein
MKAYGGMDVWLQMEVSGNIHTLATLPQRKETAVSTG